LLRPDDLRRSPEEKIQSDLIGFLTLRGWTIMPTHGNMFQRGFPDLYALHEAHGSRWIEVKNPKQFSFTAAQKQYFPIMSLAGVGIWILVAASEDEYAKLFRPANCFAYMAGVIPKSINHLT
jgi:hypothetical protein